MTTMTSEERRKHMRRIKSKDIMSEYLAGNICRQLRGIGYRLRRKDIAGCPDICLISSRKAIFVNGCFWHGHECKNGIRRPKSNCTYWNAKIAANQERGLRNIAELVIIHRNVLVVWECQLKDLAKVTARLKLFLT
jgi:DNA mismatch endonuclease (patch repair protein)